MKIRSRLERISAIATGFIIGGSLYANPVSAKYEGILSQRGMPMPEITGGLSGTPLSVRREKIFPPNSEPETIHIRIRSYIRGKNNWENAYHLECDGRVEDNPYAILVSEKGPEGRERFVLHLDLDRDGLREKRFTEPEVYQHSPVDDAPQCS